MALFCALAAGERALTHLALVADQPEPLSPCGICRQVIAELAPNATIVMANLDGQVRLASIGELLPVAFCLPTVRPDDGARG
jgi:cytidine deaminase